MRAFLCKARYTEINPSFSATMKKLILALAVAATTTSALATNYIRMPMNTITSGQVQQHPATAELRGSPGPEQGASELMLSTMSLTFGETVVGATSGVRTITVSNPGSTALASSVQPTGPFTVIQDNCGPTLAPGADCSVAVALAPSVAAREVQGTVAIGGKAVALSGSAILAQYADFSLTFPSFVNGIFVGSTETLNATLRNNGTAPVALSSFSTNNPEFTASVDSRAASCKTLQPGASCAVRISFKPQAAGTHARPYILSIAHNGSDKYGVSIPLAGDSQATAPVYAAGPALTKLAAMSFIARKNRSSITSTQMQISNTGNEPAIIGTPVITGPGRAHLGNFNNDPGSCQVIQPGQQCYVYYTVDDNELQALALGEYPVTIRIPNNSVTGDLASSNTLSILEK